MSLNIKQGDTITIVFEGEDEKAASKAAEKFLKDNLWYIYSVLKYDLQIDNGYWESIIKNE